MPGENGGAGRSPTSGPTPQSPPPRPASAWAPLRFFPVFRALWIAQFASNVGTWMQTVGRAVAAD
jgi:Transmembrane secretion effector